MINYGTYRHRLTIQEKAQVFDSTGGSTVSWSDLITTWGKVEPMRGKQQLEAGQVVEGKPYKIKARYRDDLDTLGSSSEERLTENYRLKYDNRLLTMHSVIDVDERKKVLEIIAVERAT